MNASLPDRLTLAAFSVVVLLGGLNAVAVRFSNQELPPFWGAALGFAFASVSLLLIVYFQPAVAITRGAGAGRGRSLWQTGYRCGTCIDLLGLAQSASRYGPNYTGSCPSHDAFLCICAPNGRLFRAFRGLRGCIAQGSSVSSKH